MTLDILYTAPGGNGWGPVERLARLAARLLDGALVRFDDRGSSFRIRARGLLPRTRRGPRQALVIAAQPDHLNALLAAGVRWSSYERTAGWVIDSFWWDRVPRIARRGGFDVLYVTDPDDASAWAAQTSCPVGWLPWGADALSTVPSEKPLDLLRVGRQPPEWDDDERTATAAREASVSFRGRPPFGDSDAESQRFLARELAVAKHVLAFSNRVDESSYTHPVREYLTGRWTDALAHGAVVAGIPPRSAAARALLWDGACLDLGTTGLEDGMHSIRTALSLWTPAVAERNRIEALRRLDWRHRLRTIAEDLDLPSSIPLTDSLRELAGRSGEQPR